MAIIDLRPRYPIALAWPRLAYTLSKLDHIAIHHSVTPTPSASATQSTETSILDAIHRHHLGRGFGGIGYHEEVFPSGRAYQSCKLTQWGANVGGHNDHLYGVCVIGTYTNGPASSKAIEAAAVAVDHIDRFLGRKLPLAPHHRWTSTACPAQVNGQISGIRAALAPPPPTGAWAEVRPITKKSVTLYQPTPLVNLNTGAKVIDLAQNTSISVSGIYRDSHYISTYSFLRQIANGFAVTATIKPTSCAAELERIRILQGQLALAKTGAKNWERVAEVRATQVLVLEETVAKIRALVR